MASFVVFIVYSKVLNKYFVGYAIDLSKRLLEHNSGISTFTSKSKDWEIKYTEVFPDRESLSGNRGRSNIAINILMSSIKYLSTNFTWI